LRNETLTIVFIGTKGAAIDVQQSNAMVFNRFCRKTGLPLVGLVALLF
jgi:hypothetical protein